MAKKLNRYENFVKRVKHCHHNEEQAIFFISAPSAAGKDGLWKFLSKMGYDKKYQLHKVISTTTRYPRINEICGYDYFFTPKCALTDKKGKFLSFCVNPVSFGKDISGEHVWYCYTEKELEEPLKEGKSLFFNVIGSAVPFYKDYFSERFPNVKLISTCWTITADAQKEKFYRREPNKTAEELQAILDSRAPERKMYDKLIAKGIFDFVDDASIRLVDWKHKQYKKHNK